MYRYACALALVLCTLPLSATAEQVTCESREDRKSECDLDTRDGVRIVELLSKSPCVEGESWGRKRGSVWVKDGCRAVFESGNDSRHGAQQYGSSSSAESGRVTCESEDHRQVECGMPHGGQIRMVEQLSRAECVQGRSWGQSGSGVWVKDGCRAVFEAEPEIQYSNGSDGSGVTCESQDRQQVECELASQGRIHMVEQLSRAECVEGRSWGTTRSGVWVKDGCRAKFASEPEPRHTGRGLPSGNESSSSTSGKSPNSLVCESTDRQQVECALESRGRIRMVEQLSRAECVEGRSWGTTGSGVWVKDGCRARFEADAEPVRPSSFSRGRSLDQVPPPAAVSACQAFEKRKGEVVRSAPLRSGGWEIVMRYQDGDWICEVGRDGKVASFEALH